MKFLLAFFILFLTNSLFAHKINQSEARSILEKMNIEYSVEAFCEAADKDDVKIIELFHMSGQNLDTECSLYGTTLLYNAIDKESERVFRYLIDNGANINNYSKYNGKTVFVEALSTSRYDWAYELLNLGADTRQRKTDDGKLSEMTALGYTLLECDNTLLKAVLKNGASPNEFAGITAINSVRLGCLINLKTLVEAGADVNLQVGMQYTPLMNYNSEDYVKYLLEKGADPNIMVSGIDAVFLAVIEKKFFKLMILKDFNAKFDRIYKMKKISIPFILQNNKMLVEKLSTSGLTLLQISKLLGYEEIYEFLFKMQEISS